MNFEFQRDVTTSNLDTKLDIFLQKLNNNKEIWWLLTSRNSRNFSEVNYENQNRDSFDSDRNSRYYKQDQFFKNSNFNYNNFNRQNFFRSNFQSQFYSYFNHYQNRTYSLQQQYLNFDQTSNNRVISSLSTRKQIMT